MLLSDLHDDYSYHILRRYTAQVETTMIPPHGSNVPYFIRP